MKVNFNKEFKTLDGATVLNEEKPLSLKTVAVTALLTPAPEETISGEEKAERYLLAESISKSNGSPISVKAEDVSLLKKLIGELYLPLIVGQAYRLLEGE